MSAQVSFGPVGIIDIGSNSVRLVIYGGAERVPSILYNEKVMAGLGRTIDEDGAMDPVSMEEALATLARFRLVTRRVGVRRLRTVATAAVRDATNGPDFLAACARLGIKPALLSGEEEAVGAARGVLSAIPGASGVVADLGGGSLELAGVARGAVGNVLSLPIGVLRVGDPPNREKIAQVLDTALDGNRLAGAAKGKTLYLVGGSFRALAQLDMHLADHPLPIAHAHIIDRERLPVLAEFLAGDGINSSDAVGRISSLRIPLLPAALATLEILHERFQPKAIVTSAYGLREGLLYSDLSDRRKEEDPLLAAALEVGHRLGRFGDHGALLDQWIAPLFKGEGAALSRLRLATCLLGDIAWNAHPDFRAERAVDLGVHGNWVGVNAHDRILIGRALFTAFGGDGGFEPQLEALLSKRDIKRANSWGRAIRFAQRLSAGTASLLRKTSLEMDGRTIILAMQEKQRNLYSAAVVKRFEQLGAAMNKKLAVRFT